MSANLLVDVLIMWVAVLTTVIVVTGSSDTVDGSPSQSATTMAAVARRIPSTATGVTVDPDRQLTTADEDKVDSDWAVWSSTDQPQQGGGLYVWTPDGSRVGYRVLPAGGAGGRGPSGVASRPQPKALNPVAVSVTLHRSPSKPVNRVEQTSTKASTGAELSEEQHTDRMRRKQFRLFSILKQVNDQIGRGVAPPSRNDSRSAAADDDDDVNTDDSSSTLSAGQFSSFSADSLGKDPCVRNSGNRRTSMRRIGEVRLRRSRRRHVTDAADAADCVEVGDKTRKKKRKKNRKEATGSQDDVGATSSDAAYTITSTCVRRPATSNDDDDDRKRFKMPTERDELAEIKGIGGGVWIDFNVSSHCVTTVGSSLTVNLHKQQTSTIVTPADASVAGGTGVERHGARVSGGTKRRQSTAGKKRGTQDDRLVVITVYQTISRPGRGKAHQLIERLRPVGKVRTRHSYSGWVSVEINDKFVTECEQLALYVQLTDRATASNLDPRAALDLPPHCNSSLSPESTVESGNMDGSEKVPTVDHRHRLNNLPYIESKINKSHEHKTTTTTTTSRQQHHRRRRHRTTLNKRF